MICDSVSVFPTLDIVLLPLIKLRTAAPLQQTRIMYYPQFNSDYLPVVSSNEHWCSFDSIECDLGECLRRSCRHLCCMPCNHVPQSHQVFRIVLKTRQSRFQSMQSTRLPASWYRCIVDRHFTCTKHVQFAKYEVYCCKCAAPISVMIHEPHTSNGRVSIIAENHYYAIYSAASIACLQLEFIRPIRMHDRSVGTINIYSLLIHGGCQRNVCLPANCTHHNQCAKRIK